MSKTIIKAIPNGPYTVKGDEEIYDAKGNLVFSSPDLVISLCRCGASGKKPLCDGSHRAIGFKDPDNI